MFGYVGYKTTHVRTEVMTNNDKKLPFDYIHKIGDQMLEQAMAQNSVYTLNKSC